MKIATQIAIILVVCGCREHGPKHKVDESHHNPPTEISLKAPKLNLSQPYSSYDNLNTLYEAAVCDFARYEAKRKESSDRVYRLKQVWESIRIDEDGDQFDYVDLAPEQFRGIKSTTALGDRLLSIGDVMKTDESRIQNVGVIGIKLSESRHRAQITLAWVQTISLSWTFLYEINDSGVLVFVKGVVYGCSSPESWIDDPTDPMNALGDQITSEQVGGGNTLEPPSHPSTAPTKARATP